MNWVIVFIIMVFAITLAGLSSGEDYTLPIKVWEHIIYDGYGMEEGMEIYIRK